MNKIILWYATSSLIIGYVIHAINFGLLNYYKLSIAMIFFAFAMWFLFT